MKKIIIGLFAIVLAVSMMACKGEVSSGSKIPADFVKVTGSTVNGGTKFEIAGPSLDWYKGVFREGRTVTIADFYMCDHEITQAEYETVMGNNPSKFKGESYPPAEGEIQENRPVETVSWYDAIEYCNKRSIAEKLKPCYKINGKTNPSGWGKNHSDWDAVICDFTANGYRLPTEIEWEYAARGGKTGCEVTNPDDWAGTDDSSEIDKYAWYSNNSGGKTHEVKKDKIAGIDSANGLGLYDMSGNVYEWCWDWYDYYTDNTPSITPETPVTGVASGSYRVNRGGCYIDGEDGCKVARRFIQSPFYRDEIGFRIVRTTE